MRGNVIETVMGAVVLLVAALFLVFAYKTSELRSVPGYRVSADFERVDGIHARAAMCGSAASRSAR